MIISKKLFLERYMDLHDRIFPSLIEEQPEEKLRHQAEGKNSALWIYWHLIRTEDIGVQRFIRDVPQVYLKWQEAVNVPTMLNGTGMDKEQVNTITNNINLNGLIQYRRAVKEASIQVIQNMDSSGLSKTPAKEKVRQIICDEGTMPASTWHLLDLYYGKSKEWYLLHVCLTHPFYHLGQMMALL